jgi:hypothetical protein
MTQIPSIEQQRTIDQEHLRLLAIFFYLVGGLTALFSSVGLIHFGFGMAMAFFPELFNGPGGQGAPPPPFVGYLFAFVGGSLVLFGWTVGALTIYSGRSIQKRKRRTLTLAVAALNCLNCTFFPFGLLLGTLSIIVLCRPSVSQLYETTVSTSA